MPDGDKFYGQPLKIYDFKKGLWTVDPALLIPDGASPNCQNVWFDEEGALNKMPGTNELLNSVSESYNQFMRNPPWELFTYLTAEGSEKLIIQGMDTGNTTMELWALNRQGYYPANLDPTDITPASTLVTYRRCCFVTYITKLYLFNGVDNFKSWDGTTWTEYFPEEDEQFRFGCVYDDCLFAARSGNNPTRVIFTEQNEEYFQDYYRPPYSHWRDFPVTKGGPITGILATPMGSLMVFGRNWIQELTGSPVNDTDSRRIVSIDKGAIDHWSIGVIGERIIFAWDDGLYVTGNTGVIVSAEDQKLKTESRVTNVTSEIRNYWKDNFIIPDPMQTKEKKWSGYSDFAETLAFDAGESEILPYEIITGGTSGATARVLVVDVTSGAWTGTAAGDLYVTEVSGGPFQNNEDINVGSVKHAVANGANSGWTLVSCLVNKAPITDNPDVINFDSVYGTQPEGQNQSDVSDATWVDLRSDIGKNQFFSQGFKLGYDPAPVVDRGICRGVALYMKETGDFSGNTLDVYVTADSSDKPDFDSVYAEGQLSGDFLNGIVELEFDSGSEEPLEGAKIELNGDAATTYGTIERVYLKSGQWSGGDAAGYFYITSEGGSATWTDDGQIDINGGTANIATVDEPITGDSSPISTGCWVFCEMNYWNYPQNMFDGDYSSPPQIYIGIKSNDDTDSNYISWCYKSGDTYTDGQMVNSDSDDPEIQSDLDYCFRYYGNYIDTTATVSSTSYQADSDLDHWENIYVDLDKDTLGDYTRNSILEKIEYEVQSADSGWGTWTETENGGEITGSGRWLRWKLTFSRATGYAIDKMDSFTMREIKVSYVTENTSDLLVTSATKDDRYWFSSKMNTVDGDCLYFDGNDNVWIQDSTSLDIGTNDFAVEFWIKGASADQAASYSGIIGNWAGYYSVTGDHGWDINISKSGGKVGYHIDSAATCATMAASPNLLDGSPHHVAMNFDRSDEVTAWVDNVEVGGTHDISSISATSLSNDLPFLLGALAVRLNAPDIWTPSVWYTGKLRQLRLYKGRLLTTTEIAYNYANPSECQDTSNLVGWWKCTEGQGDTIGDYSGSDNVGVRGNGVVQNKPAWTYWDETAKVALFGGQLCMDRNGAIFPRTGQNMLKVSTMANFDNKLVMGVGVDGTAYPNLVYLDKTKSTEVGVLGTGSSATIESKWDSKVYCTETLSRVTRLEIVYYNDSSYESGSGSGFYIQYRKDEAVDDDNVPTFTTLKSIELSATVTDRDKYQYFNKDVELETEGKNWQFRVLSNNKFKILWFKPWIRPEPITQD